MAYDRNETRDAPRGERARWREERHPDRDFDRDRDERGFFERAGDEVASWFGDEDAERRRREDHLRHERERGFAGDRRPGREHGWREPYRPGDRGGFSERDYNPSWRSEFGGRGYRPMTGDYGRGEHESEQFFAASGYGRGERGFGNYRSDFERSQGPWARDDYRRTSRAGTADWSDRSRHQGEFDPHYRSWRERHLSELDRDYDDYRRENQSRFESDFGSWRERRQQKRGLLGQVREHMEVVGSDDEHVGTVDRVAGDRLILTRSDPESGGAHHSLSCSEIDRVEGDRVILDCPANEARNRWRDESRSRALFEREDQGEVGPHALNRSFEGTYR